MPSCGAAVLVLVSLGVMPDVRAEPPKKLILIAASADRVGESCRINFSISNRAGLILDRLSVALEGHHQLGRFTVELVAPGSYRGASGWVNSYCDNDAVVRIVRIKACVLGGRALSADTCGILVGGPPAEFWQLPVVYEPIPR